MSDQTVYMVKFPAAGVCYFGDRATAEACARQDGTVEVVALPARDFKVIQVQPSSELADADNKQLREQLNAANARAEAAEANDRRYRWLRLDGRPCDRVEFVEVNNGCGAFGAATEGELDAAIDAALDAMDPAKVKS